MAYIGNGTDTFVRNDYQFTATAGQVTFIADYTVGYVDVFWNGLKLDSSEYTANNSTTIVLNSSTILGDKVQILAYNAFNIADAATTAQLATKSDIVASSANAMHITRQDNWIFNEDGTVTGALQLKITGLYTQTLSGSMKIVITQNGVADGVYPDYEFDIAGNWRSSDHLWHNTEARVSTNDTDVLNVRFCNNDTDVFIVIGEVTTVWDYPRVVIKDIVSNAIIVGYTPDFVISRITTLPSIVNTTISVSSSIALFGGSVPSLVYGLIHNKTNDTYKRFGTGTLEDSTWLSTFATRLNDNSNSDAITNFYNSSVTVQGNMKRVVVSNAGAYVKDYKATDYSHPDQTGLLVTQTVMVQIPKFYYVSIEFVYNNDTYNFYAQSLNSFSINLVNYGFPGATSILGSSATNYKSYGTIVGTVITSVVHNAFNHASEGEKNVLYVGAFESYNDGTNYRSSCTTTGTSTPVKAVASQTIATFRAEHQGFGVRFQTQNWFIREAIALTLLIERGTYQTETNGINNFSKWEGYSWNTGAGGDDQNLGLTLGLLNTTGVIKNASNYTVAVSYRGIENPYGHLWEFVDGCNIISGAVWLAKHGSIYTSDTIAAPYFTSGRTTLTAGAGVYISDVHEGTFIPSAATGATNVTKMTDGAWFATGNTVLCVGGALNNAGLSGVLSWGSNAASSTLYWYYGSRFATLS